MNKNPWQKANELEERLIDFAVRIVRLSTDLPKGFAGQYFGKQVLRSGSAPALLYAEARGGESDADFRHKCSIALKELRETHVNIKIISRSGLYAEDRLESLIDETNQLISIFVATVRSLDKKLNHEK